MAFSLPRVRHAPVQRGKLKIGGTALHRRAGGVRPCAPPPAPVGRGNRFSAWALRARALRPSPPHGRDSGQATLGTPLARSHKTAENFDRREASMPTGALASSKSGSRMQGLTGCALGHGIAQQIRKPIPVREAVGSGAHHRGLFQGGEIVSGLR
jgi:hypothetical protein